MQKGFFAYGSQISSSGECIEEAIGIINSQDHGVEIKSWKDLFVNGNPIITKIIQEIDASDFFCADLTGLNDNVLFELGYALSKGIPLFLINDSSQLESVRKFKELGLLTSIGYHSYTNTANIVEGFARERPYDPIDNHWEDLKKNLSKEYNQKAILALNSQHDTNFNLEIVNQLEYHRMPSVVDDASESVVQSITWYLEQLHSVPAVLVQFSSQSRSGHDTHNSKCSLISGMALGLGLKLQMVAEKPYSIPIDFRDLLKKFSNRTELSVIVKEFLEKLKGDIAELLVARRRVGASRRKESELLNLNFGESIAEHESENVYDYYVDNQHTEQLIKNEYNIVVGRKGTGKTATLYYLNDYLSEDKRNNVILIKPINFEVDGLISLMEESNNEFEKGFLIEAIWKFLIYTEIAKYLYYKVNSKPLYAQDDTDRDYLKFIQENEAVYLTDFSTRLEEQLKILKLNKINEIGAGNNKDFRLKVSELLHDASIAEMKAFFSKLVKKREKLIVLIDNLDKSWRKDSNIGILSKYLLGLLSVSGRVFKDLSYVKSTDTNISFHLTIFLRSDIFKQIVAYAREPDKIEVSRLNWEDPDKLFRIIEDRFVELSKGDYKIADLWDRFITKTVNGIPTKEYIARSIFPRPRDIIFFIRTCKEMAISRGHEMIEEKDIISAHEEYSSWVFKTLLVENGVSYDQMEEFMYEMMTCNQILTRDDIIAIMSKVKFKVGEEEVEEFIDHLVNLTIVGREIKTDQYGYEHDVDKAKKLKTLGSKIENGRFRVHDALAPYLECTMS
jgi:Cdc6-like AAA superfamily ATPase